MFSKYDKLWQDIQANKDSDFELSFEEIGKITETPLDHSFLRYKKELKDYGFEVAKISLKNESVKFKKLG
ncbi:hypothetical protein [Lactobacillus hominis]|uniref:hypothetical protein n=1 Tax=Lactobacillus hominis TaxID=1203033 RepID=UPI00058B11E5|nr:hypothetical protein [Lactobacillus hominis]MCT3347838.1 hypothetical protein [Lactobacillus hominis]